MTSRLFSSLLTLLLFIGASFSQGWAATVIQLSLEEMTINSEVIVHGTVLETRAVLDEGKVFSIIRLRTVRVLKGDTHRKEWWIRQPGGRIGNRARYVPGLPSFQIGEEVIVFGERIVDGYMIVTGLAQGKFTVVVGPDHQTLYVIPNVDNLHLVQQETDIKGVAKDERKDALSPSQTLLPSQPSRVHSQVWSLDNFREAVGAVLQQSGDLQ